MNNEMLWQQIIVKPIKSKVCYESQKLVDLLNTVELALWEELRIGESELNSRKSETSALGRERVNHG